MTRKLTAALAAFVMIATMTTATLAHSDYDKDADFTQYQTYTFAEESSRGHNSLIDKRIRASIQAELEARGLTLSTAGSADLEVAYATQMDDKVRISDNGFRSRRWGGTGIDVYNYTEGTLTVNMIDTNTDALVWRGWHTSSVRESSSPEKSEKQIGRFVEKALKDYPVEEK